MRVREATEGDFAEIGRLTVAAYRALDTWVGDDYAVHLADVRARADTEGVTVLVAEDEPAGPLLGSVTLTLAAGPFFEWAYGVDGDCGFRMLAVDPPAQGRGVGPRLVAECLDRARAAGCRRMVIGSTEWMTTAHRMYERRFGFRRAPELDQQWGDIRGLCFVLDLDPTGGYRRYPAGRAPTSPPFPGGRAGGPSATGPSGCGGAPPTSGGWPAPG